MTNGSSRMFSMLSGLFSSIDSIPVWAKVIAEVNPITHFVAVMRMVIRKGSTFHDVRYHFAAVLALAVVANTWAILNYRRTT